MTHDRAEQINVYNMRYFSYLVVATMIFGTALTSCKKNDDNQRDWLLETIIVSQYNALSDNVYQVKYVLEYDNKNRITKRIMHNYSHWIDDWGGEISPISLNYNADGCLVEYDSKWYWRDPWNQTAFFQNDNKITFTTTYYHPLGSTNGTINGELELNVQGLPVKLTSEHIESSISYAEIETRERVINLSYTATLTWQNGNLTKTIWEREDETLRYIFTDLESKELVEREESSSSGTITFTHDEKKTPFYHCNTPKWFFLWNEKYGFGSNYEYNANNIKTETIEDGSTITYEYTYNDDGFPATRTWGAASIWMEGTTTETYTYKMPAAN